MNLGQIIPEHEVAERDAVHIAVVPIVASERIGAGCPVGLSPTGEAVNYFRYPTKAVGVADPYLLKDVQKGERFYLFLKPNTITALRHEWTHPAFDLSTPAPNTQSLPSAAARRRAATRAAAPAPLAMQQKIHPTAHAVAEMLTTSAHKQLLMDFANQIDISLDELIDGARDYAQRGEYMSEGEKFESVSIPKGFWEAYQAFTQEVVPAESQDNFFSCSC
jgi:hypothetical protein